MKKPASLSRRFVRFACVLTAAVFFVTGTIAAALCYEHLRSRQRANSDMIMEALAGKINESLVSVERTVNTILKMEDVIELAGDSVHGNDDEGTEITRIQQMDDATDPAGRNTGSYYAETRTRLRIERQIGSLIQQNRDIDGVVVKIGDAVMASTNTTLLDPYRFQSGKAPEEILTAVNAGRRNRYLLYRYLQDKSSFNCVVFPIAAEDQPPVGFVAVVLSREYADSLELREDHILLSDGTDSAEDNDSAEAADPMGLQRVTCALNWDGWTVTYINYSPEIRGYVRETFLWWALIGAGLLLLIFILSRIYIRMTFAPVQQMADRIQDISLEHLRPQPLTFHGRGSLRTRLNVFLSLAIILTVTVNYALFQFRTAQIIERSIGSEMATGAHLVARRSAAVLRSKRQLMRNTIISEAIQRYMDPSTDRNEQELTWQITEILSENGDIANIALYDREGNMLFSSSFREELMKESGIEKQLDYLRESPVSFLVKAVEERLFNSSLIRMGMPFVNINPSNTASNLWGYIFIDWRAGENLLQLSDGENLYGGQISYVDPFHYDLVGRRESALSRLVERDGLQRVLTEDSDLCVVAETLPESNWKVFLSIPWNLYLWQSNSLVFALLLVSLGMIVLSMAFSRRIVKKLLSDIDRLLACFMEVGGAGLAEARFRGTARTNEIAVLAEGFNRMMDELDQAVNERMSSELAAKDAEIHAREMELSLLQQQIKPHFLYNTLRTIQYMIIMGNASAAKMVEMLIVLFRTGINAENMTITVREELTHVEAYIGIQKIRFPDLFDMDVQVDESLMEEAMLKLLLQPLVENAINHGIREGSVFGHIIIRAEKKNGIMHFEVSDNGVGIEENRLKELNERLSSGASGRSVGIFNVNERIQLRYGREFGLKLYSSPGAGTRAVLRFPSQ